ncbi:hypothetical protein P7D22_19920 [Lichenihabitans sp. Uapishka_5]|uniref:hypothetical protein n=1 Tax=Lichenihabitans sp. Uapishka_5 TaxID=3037302 RepID=UPI0029E7CCEB|nr:hypothetical protein [Lichenihabitans sp. Uapishka_5]MDX7953436.1 hypothetical protein [Lichenihabitans sp. Uapishka_5]
MPDLSEPEGDHAEAASNDGVDAVLREFAGDWRAAIGALLHDIDVLARDYDAGISRGFIRGRPRLARTRPLSR